MHSKDIIAGLKQLDPENEEHWTVGGEPKVEALADLGLRGVTREIITKVAPLFSRSNADLPDLEAIKANAEAARKAAAEAVLVAEQKKREAEQAEKTLAEVDKTLKDSHTLTHQNQGWLKSMSEVEVARHETKQKIDEIIKAAGGPKSYGKHPVEVNEAARIRAKRRNIVLPAKTEQ